MLTMGPQQAETMIRDAYMMGADDAVILSDRKFAESDVLATSYTLSQGIRLLGGTDLIICDRQTTDGDTAQIFHIGPFGKGEKSLFCQKTRRRKSCAVFLDLDVLAIRPGILPGCKTTAGAHFSMVISANRSR